jgi:DNA adenine methylase
MPHYSPLRYPGGKNCIFKFVANLFNENDLDGASYAEPYAGGAGLGLRLLFEEYIGKFYINDLDRSIFSFWKVVLENSDEFCSWLKDVDVSIDSWHHYKAIQDNKESVDIFELAKSTFFLNRTNVSGVIKGGVIGGFNQEGKHKIDARFNKDDLIVRIRKIARFRSRIFISNTDGLEFIKKLERKKENVFIYLDPPYYQKGAELYMNSYSEKDHKKLAEYVAVMQKRWMVSYDCHKFILNLYSEKNKLVYKLSQSTSNRVGEEILVFSDDIYFKQSMSSLECPVTM